MVSMVATAPTSSARSSPRPPPASKKSAIRSMGAGGSRNPDHSAGGGADMHVLLRPNPTSGPASPTAARSTQPDRHRRHLVTLRLEARSGQSASRYMGHS